MKNNSRSGFICDCYCVAAAIKAPLRYISSTLWAVIKCCGIDLSGVCEEENKQGGKLKDGLMLCRLMTKLHGNSDRSFSGLSGSKPRIGYYEFAALWKECKMEREDGQEDQ